MPSLHRGPCAAPYRVIFFSYVAKLHVLTPWAAFSMAALFLVSWNRLLMQSSLCQPSTSLQRLSWARSCFYCFTFWEGCQLFIIKVPHIITLWKTTYGTMCLNVENRAIYWKKKKGKTGCSKGCAQCPSCGCKRLQELLPVLNFVIPLPKLQAQDTLFLDPAGGWCPLVYWGARQNLAIPQQKAWNTSPFIKAYRSASSPFTCQSLWAASAL